MIKQHESYRKIWSLRQNRTLTDPIIAFFLDFYRFF